MGLIDLKTDLKSLRYGKDTIGGGYSGQPYIQEKIPNGFNNLGANEDFILRGGANATGDTVTDIKRLTKMFIDTKSPNGILFIAKQNLLSRTAVRTQTSGVVNEGIYTPLNTLAQAGVVNIGGHLNKQGLNPFQLTGAYALDNDNLYSIKVKPTQDTNLNRLVTIYSSINKNETVGNFGFTKGTTINPNGLSGGKANPVLLNYIGGPGSTLGVGKTNIRYASFKTGKNNPLAVNSGSYFYGTDGINYKSVNADNVQVGGLQIKTLTPWTRQDTYYIYSAGKIGKEVILLDNLPNDNVNSPQSSSLNNTWYTGKNTWTPQYSKDPEFKWGNNEKYSSDYLNNFVTYQNTRNGGDNRLLEVFGLSPFTLNNNLVDIVVPENERKLGVRGSFIQKSVDTELIGENSLDFGAQQVGGLQVKWLTPWTKQNTYHVPYGKDKKVISFGLPNFNINSPQSESLTNIPVGQLTWESKQNVTNPNGGENANYSSQINDKTGYIYDGGASNTYKTLTNQQTSSAFTEPSIIGNKFKPNWDSNVYTQGNTFPENSPVINNNGTYTYNQKDIIDQANDPGKKVSNPTLQDFRKKLREKASTNPQSINVSDAIKSGQLIEAPDYKNQNVGNATLIGNPGERAGKSYVTYNGVIGPNNKYLGPLDKINASPIGADPAGENGSVNDLITFYITDINGNNDLNFRAFLTGFGDSYSSKINSQQMVGRGEEFYTYTGFSRKISLSWVVAALSRQELIPMYKKLSQLASNTAPNYNANGFMQGPLVTLTVGGYIKRMPGYIENLSFDWSEEYTWEIARLQNGDADPNIAQLPHIIKVSSFSFIPIPKYLPQQGARFIDLKSTTGNDLWNYFDPTDPVQYAESLKQANIGTVTNDGLIKVNENQPPPFSLSENELTQGLTPLNLSAPPSVNGSPWNVSSGFN